MFMKKILFLIFLLLFPAVSHGQPTVGFDAETHDSGTVAAGETIEHVFVIRNTGDRELIIEKVVPS
jgi:hypothetical protein